MFPPNTKFCPDAQLLSPLHTTSSPFSISLPTSLFQGSTLLPAQIYQMDERAQSTNLQVKFSVFSIIIIIFIYLFISQVEQCVHIFQRSLLIILSSSSSCVCHSSPPPPIPFLPSVL
jgi:hypothetical protein